MGIRSIERQLAAELCYEAVTKAVRDYLDESRDAGRYLYYYDNLVVPIIRAGYYPPGLLGVKEFIFREEEVLRADERLAREEGRQIRFVDEGTLIEEIMKPYPTARLRARRQREAMERFAEDQAAQWRRRDATKCNTLQQKSN
jgi:hypothetical protein